MNRYRFRTLEEFKEIGRWNDEYECPIDWAEGQEMNDYMGQEILCSDCIALCESNDAFNMDGWVFEHLDYVLIEETNKESLVGRWVKFLKNISTECPVGSYDLITEDDDDAYIYLEKYRTCARMRFRDHEIELMPIGWSPESVELPSTSDIPEYVECIEVCRDYYGEVGKIYKVKEWNHSYSDCILEGTTSGSTSRSRFKPSTKEAYEAQSKPVEGSSRFKIGDWIIWDGTYKSEPSQLASIDDGGHRDTNGNWRDTTSPYYRLALPHELSGGIEEWSAGTYVVITGAYHSVQIGDVHQIDDCGGSYVNISKSVGNGCLPSKKDCKWFATKQEAETYAKGIALKLDRDFPSKWCLRITDENKQVLDAWRRQQPGFNNLLSFFQGWLTYDSYDGSYTNWCDAVPGGYTEITYEEFVTNVHSAVLYNTTTNVLENTFTDLLITGSSAYYKGIDPYEKEKPLIEDVQSISVNLRTKKQINKLKF